MKELIIIAILLSAIGCNNTSPTAPKDTSIAVSAGNDTTYPKNAPIYLVGTITHSDFPDSVPTLRWRQVAGQGAATISDTTSLISQVTFPSTGLFSFAFAVSVGSHKALDTVTLSITDSIPFKVLEPASGDRVTIGGSFLIRWQVVTPTKMIIFLTCDNGKTYTALTTLALNLTDTSWLWTVADTLAPYDSCKVRVADYSQRSIYTESGYFSLVP